jgi:hypothetical protein
MPATYEPIATTTLGSTASSVSFTSIPGTYTDLRIVCVGSSNANGQWYARFNGLSTALYSYTNISGNGTTAASALATGDLALYFNYSNTYSTTQPAMITMDIFSYAGSTNKTSLLTYDGDRNGSGIVERTVGLWRSTAAITRVDVFSGSGSFTTGFTATLYGILKA